MPLDRRAFIAATLALSSGGLRPAAARDLLDPALVLHDRDAPVLANPGGDVTVVEFFDYQCPHCRASHPMMMAEAARDPGLRLVMKDMPVFGPASVQAARRALGATGMGRYAPALDALMQVEGPLGPAAIDAALRGAGVDPEAAEASYRRSRRRWDGLIARNLAQARALGFLGTPSYVVGFTLFPGVIDRDRLRAAVRQARG